VPEPGKAEAVHAAHTTAQAQSLLPVEVPAFEGNFMYIGTKDYCPYITFIDALNFRQSVRVPLHAAGSVRCPEVEAVISRRSGLRMFFLDNTLGIET